MTSGALPMHIPVRVARQKGEDPGWRAVCSCGHPGPFVASGEDDPKSALAREHGASEPAGCAGCGWATPPDRDLPTAYQFAWVRYIVEQRAGQWAYLCRDAGACRQRQLARWAPARVSEDPLRCVDEVPDTFTVSLNTSGEDVLRGMSITEAIAHYQLARARIPRSWADITPADKHSLIALVTAVEALFEAASMARRQVVVAARKAGSSWQDLAYATGGDDAAGFREWFLEEMDRNYDWPDEHHDEIRRLLDSTGD